MTSKIPAVISTRLGDNEFPDLQGTRGAQLREKHRIYLMGLMSIVAHYWNGNKKGVGAEYPLNCKEGQSGFNPNSYLGHNIAAIAVNAEGEIIDFDFNHNEVFDSSVEHAESRLLRRIFSQNNSRCHSCDFSNHYGNMSTGYTVYTTLESCTQCTGIMNLGNIKDVVFLQSDPTMGCIGNVVYNLNKNNSSFKGPRPIDSSERLDFKYHEQLDDAYAEFVDSKEKAWTSLLHLQ